MERDPSPAGSGAWYPGVRASRLRTSRSYGFVLLLVLASFVFIASAPDAGWAQSVLVLTQSATLVVAVWTSGLGHRAVVASLALVLLSVAATVVQLTAGGDNVAGGVGILESVLAVAICVVIAVGVFDQGEINRQSVLGVISIYMLLGILFSFVFGAAALLGSGSFFTQGTDGTPSIRLYFSFVTLATLGYGDYTPANNLGHTLAVVEALIGQLYLVTVVALVVSRLHQGPPRSP